MESFSQERVQARPGSGSAVLVFLQLSNILTNLQGLGLAASGEVLLSTPPTLKAACLLSSPSGRLDKTE